MPLRVMLVDDDTGRAASVEEGLRASGFDVLSIIATSSALLYQIEQHRPDVVLIDLQFPGRDILESLAVVNDHNPTPMVMFSQEDDPNFIKQAFEAGVITYLMEGVYPEKVRQVIDVALAQFNAYQSLREELKFTRSELQLQKLMGRAKSLLIEHKHINEEEAHQMLNRLAMNNNLKLEEVAQTVIETLAQSTSRSES